MKSNQPVIVNKNLHTYKKKFFIVINAIVKKKLFCEHDFFFFWMNLQKELINITIGRKPTYVPIYKIELAKYIYFCLY